MPSLILDDGGLIADSPVIVAFLNELAGGSLIPEGSERWRALTLEALADGCVDSGVVLRVTQLKDESRRDPQEVAAHTAKIARALDLIEADPSWLEGPFNVGHLALVCAIDWLAFRSLVPDPEAGRPRLAVWAAEIRTRPALAATRPG